MDPFWTAVALTCFAGAATVLGGLLAVVGRPPTGRGLGFALGLAAGVMVLLGIQLSYALLPNGETVALGPETAVPLTILLTVVLVNALNFVDGLDGLAAGVAR